MKPPDAEAICEAMSRAKMQRRFVPPKTLDQRTLQMLMVVRNGLVKRRNTRIGLHQEGVMTMWSQVQPARTCEVQNFLREGGA